jgi:hypothetical protein
VKVQNTRFVGVAAAVLAALSAGCGEVARNGRSPVMAVITTMEGASGADPGAFSTVLSSDVETIVERTIDGEQVSIPTVFGDNGRVTMKLMLRDPGIPGVAASPSPLNEVTFSRYRVSYSRADGRNTPGVDVPHPFDSTVTFTVPSEGSITVPFMLVRITAKEEAPLRALVTNNVIVSTIAEVTFYGRDQAGNEVIATGTIGVFFGNFGDPA